MGLVVWSTPNTLQLVPRFYCAKSHIAWWAVLAFAGNTFNISMYLLNPFTK